jgi:hypothetical protein
VGEIGLNLFSYSKLTLGPPVPSKAMEIPAGTKRYVLLLNVHTGSGDHLASHSIGGEVLSRR